MEEGTLSDTSGTPPHTSVPSPKRQAALRVAYDANVATGKKPYARVGIKTLGEVRWIETERGWSGEFGVSLEQRINLSGADLGRADLSGALLSEADLSGADLGRADLIRANLSEANLSGANLSEANLIEANLSEANLSGADLRVARLDDKTQLADSVFDTKTRLGDVFWGGASLTRVNWRTAPRLGDENAVPQAKTRKDRIDACEATARAYRGLAIALRAQGLLPFASGYRLREQRLERKAAWYGRRYGEWLFSALLDLVAGYGEAVERILFSYLLVVGSFAAAYWAVTNYLDTKLYKLAWNEALVLSLTSFHGRGFFPGSLPLGDLVAEVAAIEAVIGLFIELILIATFSRRFLGN